VGMVALFSFLPYKNMKLKKLKTVVLAVVLFGCETLSFICVKKMVGRGWRLAC
jgi:hypothetical protein